MFKSLADSNRSSPQSWSDFKSGIFNGRGTRSEFWYWHLFVFLSAFAIGFVGEAHFPADVDNVITLFQLVIFIPTLAVSIRRLHDTNHRGWWLLIGITIIGYIPLIYWFCVKGDEGPNRFGPGRNNVVAEAFS